MKTHTPGPWIEKPTTCGNPRKPYTVRMDIVTTSGEWNPAFVAGDILPEDARLIAAAPDLLSALKSLVDDFERIIGRPIEAEHEAKAAISKATGGAA
jgi:hypothetical protein